MPRVLLLKVETVKLKLPSTSSSTINTTTSWQSFIHISHFSSTFFQKNTTKSFLFLFIKMDFLSDDLIINIAVRVVAHSVHNLFHFMRTNKRHEDLCRSRDVSRAFGDDCTELLTDLCPTYEKLDFMNRLWNAGNHMFCMLRCT